MRLNITVKRTITLRGSCFNIWSEIKSYSENNSLFFNKVNETNLQLQGDGLNLMKTKAVISAFVAKLWSNEI